MSDAQSRGVRRIGLTSLNPSVCPSDKSEPDPSPSKYIRSDPTRR